jgi:hypothetical protein
MLPFNRIIAVVMILLIIIIITLVSMMYDSTNQIGSFSDARSVCESTGISSCESVGVLPSTWDINEFLAGNGGREKRTCKDIISCNSCESCGFS